MSTDDKTLALQQSGHAQLREVDDDQAQTASAIAITKTCSSIVNDADFGRAGIGFVCGCLCKPQRNNCKAK